MLREASTRYAVFGNKKKADEEQCVQREGGIQREGGK